MLEQTSKNRSAVFRNISAAWENNTNKGSVAAASLLIASRGGASPQKLEKRVLTIFRLEPDPYAIRASTGPWSLVPDSNYKRTESNQHNLLLSNPTTANISGDWSSTRFLTIQQKQLNAQRSYQDSQLTNTAAVIYSKSITH